jgi:hypothetical protein
MLYQFFWKENDAHKTVYIQADYQELARIIFFENFGNVGKYIVKTSKLSIDFLADKIYNTTVENMKQNKAYIKQAA